MMLNDIIKIVASHKGSRHLSLRIVLRRVGLVTGCGQSKETTLIHLIFATNKENLAKGRNEGSNGKTAVTNFGPALCCSIVDSFTCASMQIEASQLR